MTYTGVPATIFTGIEPAVALSLACIPFLRPLVKGKAFRTTGVDSPYASRTLGSRTLGSKAPSNGTNRPFKELSDDSSEVQLQPLGGDSLKYEADVRREEGPKGHKQPSTSTGAILVSKGWDIVSGTRDEERELK